MVSGRRREGPQLLELKECVCIVWPRMYLLNEQSRGTDIDVGNYAELYQRLQIEGTLLKMGALRSHFGHSLAKLNLLTQQAETTNPNGSTASAA